MSTYTNQLMYPEYLGRYLGTLFFMLKGLGLGGWEALIGP